MRQSLEITEEIRHPLTARLCCEVSSLGKTVNSLFKHLQYKKINQIVVKLLSYDFFLLIFLNVY